MRRSTAFTSPVARAPISRRASSTLSETAACGGIPSANRIWKTPSCRTCARRRSSRCTGRPAISSSAASSVRRRCTAPNARCIASARSRASTRALLGLARERAVGVGALVEHAREHAQREGAGVAHAAVAAGSAPRRPRSQSAAGMRRPPGGWSSHSSSAPAPHAEHERVAVALQHPRGRTVGRARVCARSCAERRRGPGARRCAATARARDRAALAPAARRRARGRRR